MGKFGKYGGHGPATGMHNSFRKKLDNTYCDSPRDQSFTGSLTRSIWNGAIAPGNNRAGREFGRNNGNNSPARILTGELSNSFFRGSRKGPKGGNY